MATVINKVDAATAPFVGQGDLIIFSSTFANSKTYENAKLSDFQSPLSLGQIVQDSTSWEGEDVSTDQILDEQGNLITARVTAGTLGFSFDIASTSRDMVRTFLNGVNVGNSSTGAASMDATGAIFFDGDTADTAVYAAGFGVSLPVITRPIAVLNDELNRAWIYPKAKITANLTLSDGLYRIHAVVLAENVAVMNAGGTYQLTTGMIVDKS